MDFFADFFDLRFMGSRLTSLGIPFANVVELEDGHAGSCAGILKSNLRGVRAISLSTGGTSVVSKTSSPNSTIHS